MPIGNIMFVVRVLKNSSENPHCAGLTKRKFINAKDLECLAI